MINLLQFSQINWIYWFNIPSKGPIMIVDIPPLKFEVSGITRLLRKINAQKGPWCWQYLSCWVLKEDAPVIASFLQYIFTLSIQNRSSPKWLGHCKWHPSFQKKKSREPSNYRPISLTSVSCKIMEHIIYRHIMNHLDSNSILVHYQHGFRQQHSYEMQLITVIESVAGNLDRGQ